MQVRNRGLRPNRKASDSELGATATEYGLLVLFIAIAIVLGVTAFGSAVNNMFGGFATWVSTNM